jgi:hypothetical protein
MDTSSIIATVLASSVLASALTLWGNWMLNKNNYRDDYYKKILDKRLSAYEDIEGILAELNIKYQDEEGRILHNIFAYGRKSYLGFFNTLLITISKDIWFSEDMSKSLTDLNVFLVTNFEHKMVGKSDKESNLLLAAISYNCFDEFEGHIKKMRRLLYRDLNQMHDVESFINQLRPERTPYELDKPSKL